VTRIGLLRFISKTSVDSLKTEVDKRHVRHGFKPLFFLSLAVIVVVAGAARLLPIIFFTRNSIIIRLPVI
jgi:hypothetical protein